MSATPERHVAILDDDVALCVFLREVAESAGFGTSVAHDGRDLAALIAAEPMLFVLDLAMPGVDGIEVLRHLAAARFAGQLVLISGFDLLMLHAARTLAEMQGLHVAGVLTKPIRAQALRALLEGPRPDECKNVAAPEIALADLARGIDNDELVLHYQPQVRLSDGAWVGVEALVRWQHPQHGLLLPASFVALAETGGLALALTRKVIDIALREFPGAAAAKAFTGSLSINLPPAAMTDVGIPDAIVTAVEAVGRDTVRFMFEVTETSVSPDPTMALDILTRLRLKGFALSIDDFGTGHSSLEKLKFLPFSELKIDLGFVSVADTDASARVIVENSIALGRKLGLTVVAEGVESETLWRWLRGAGCDLAQWYFISRALPLDQIAQWKARWDTGKPLSRCH